MDDRVKWYAMGDVDYSKFKSLLNKEPPSGNYVAIDWTLRKRVRKIIRRLLNHPRLQIHRFVARLFNAVR